MLLVGIVMFRIIILIWGMTLLVIMLIWCMTLLVIILIWCMTLLVIILIWCMTLITMTWNLITMTWTLITMTWTITIITMMQTTISQITNHRTTTTIYRLPFSLIMEHNRCTQYTALLNPLVWIPIHRIRPTQPIMTTTTLQSQQPIVLQIQILFQILKTRFLP